MRRAAGVPARPVGGAAAARGVAAIALAFASFTACQVPAGQPGASGPATPGPKAAPSSRIGIADLTGAWVFGVRNEPGPGPVATCAPDQVMDLAQEGQRVLGSVSTRTGVVRQLEQVEGENVAGRVTLVGTYRGNLAEEPVEVRYALTFDPATQHLRGKRLDETFWAAPYVDPGPGTCGPRPSASPGAIR